MRLFYGKPTLATVWKLPCGGMTRSCRHGVGCWESSAGAPADDGDVLKQGLSSRHGVK